MKTKPNQTNKLILILSGIFLLSFSACKNKSDEQTAVTPNLSQIHEVIVKNGRLAFRDRKAYENTIILPPADTTNRKKVDSVALRTSTTKITYSGFTSMLDAYNKKSNPTSRLASDTMSINDENLATFVSPEGIIEIGEWIFKINPAKSLVTVLNEKDENLYQDLLNDVSNPKIYKFSTNDDVLDLLEEGQTMGSISNNRVAILCGGGADKSSEDSPTRKASDNREISGTSAYKKFGVYFHLYTSGILHGPKDGSLVIQHAHAYYYKTNCKNYAESGPYIFNNDLYTRDYNYHAGNNTYDCVQEIYMSTRGLSDYMVLARYIYKGIRVDVPLIEKH